jgi:hypothetical protein
LTDCHHLRVKFFIQDGKPDAVHFREKLLHVMVYELFTAPSAGCGLLEAQSPSVSRIVIANRIGVVLVFIGSSPLLLQVPCEYGSFAHRQASATASVLQGSPALALVLGLVSQLAQVSVVLLASAGVAALQRSQGDLGLAGTSRSCRCRLAGAGSRPTPTFQASTHRESTALLPLAPPCSTRHAPLPRCMCCQGNPSRCLVVLLALGSGSAVR